MAVAQPPSSTLGRTLAVAPPPVEARQMDEASFSGDSMLDQERPDSRARGEFGAKISGQLVLV
ncbi:MAG: hypothetical protein MUQ10_14275 [Anaerolineae bacterium]|nr:hypothetical protein [Anaerolineae bacterium]